MSRWRGVEKIQSTRLKSKGQGTAWPCQRWNGLLVLILARLWTGFVDIFLKKSDCSVHIPKARDTLYLFLPLSRKSLLSHSQGTSLKFLNQEGRFMQYRRLKGGKPDPPSLQWSPFPCINSFPARCPEACWDIAPEKTRGYRMIAPYLISLYKNLGLQNKFLHGKSTLAAQPMLWPEAQTLAGDDGTWAVEHVTAKTKRPHRSVIRSFIVNQMSRLASIQIFSFQKKCTLSYDNKKA